jgi:hypothetical protein
VSWLISFSTGQASIRRLRNRGTCRAIDLHPSKATVPVCLITWG